MKKFNIFVLVFALLFSNISFGSEYPSVSAKSAIVMDDSSGRILFSKNSDAKLAMASTTKIITAIVGLENGKLNDIINTSLKAAHVEGSSIWLEENEKITMENALYGLMLNSGNDAAISIAEHIAGDTDKFAKLMNSLAKKVGAYNSNFVNPNGLDADGHYTTAYDLGLLTRYGLSIPKFAEIVKTKEKKIPWEGHEWDRSLKNHNKLLWQYEYCNGVKTGFTKKSGRCLVSSAVKDGYQLVTVTLSAGDDWNDHRNMFEYAFNTYMPKLIFTKNQYVKTLVVKGGKKNKVMLVTKDKLSIPLSENEDNITYQYNGPEIIEAPVSKYSEIGKMDIYLNEKIIGSVALNPANYIEEVNYFNDLKKALKNWIIMFNGNNQIS